MNNTTFSLVPALRWRYAVKDFDTTAAVPAEAWNDIREAMRLSPSAFGLQPWRFIEVTDKALRQRLRELGYGQSKITDADKLVVLAARTDLTKADVDEQVAVTAAARSMTPESLQGYHDAMMGALVTSRTPEQQAQWASRQLYIALGFGLAAAAAAGVDAGPMEGFDAAAVNEALGLPALGLHAYVMVAFGVRSPDDKYATLAKARLAMDTVFIQK